jgi:hypothetical protein
MTGYLSRQITEKLASYTNIRRIPELTPFNLSHPARACNENRIPSRNYLPVPQISEAAE